MNENTRIATLRKYQILDTPRERAFDHITKLTTKVLNVPIAIISIVDTDRIWFKSTHGIDVTQIFRESGLCASAILGKEIHIVEDALTDVRTKENSLVTSEFGLRFYAGVPLTVKNGKNLGTLCIIDKKPRNLTAKEISLLKDLGDLVVELLETKRSVIECETSQIDTSNVLKSIYESTQKASTFIGNDLKIRYTNQAAKNVSKIVFGKEKEIGDDAMDYVLPQHKKEFKRLFNKALSGDQIEVEKSDGKSFYNITIHPVYNQNNAIIGMAHTIQDITHTRRNYQRLVQQNELLKRITWQQCHEVRRPVSNILGFCSLLKDNLDIDQKERETYINHLYDATKELDHIIHQIVAQSIENYKEI